MTAPPDPLATGSGLPAITLGIDAGATLCKIACLGTSLELAAFPAGDLDAIRHFVTDHAPDRVVATGGGATRLGAELPAISIQHELEFAAWARGAPALATRQGAELPARYLLVSIGTGTSMLAVTPQGFERVGGTALGGGTLLGLGALLLGATDFQALTALGRSGDRKQVDLLVGDIYGFDTAPIAPTLNAASFAKLTSREPADLAHALLGMIGENIGLLSSAIAKAHHLDCIVYGGSTLQDNHNLHAILHQLASLGGHAAVFLADGGHCGAVGAALTPAIPSAT